MNFIKWISWKFHSFFVFVREFHIWGPNGCYHLKSGWTWVQQRRYGPTLFKTSNPRIRDLVAGYGLLSYPGLKKARTFNKIPRVSVRTPRKAQTCKSNPNICVHKLVLRFPKFNIRWPKSHKIKALVKIYRCWGW